MEYKEHFINLFNKFILSKGTTMKTYGFLGIEAPGYWWCDDGKWRKLDDISNIGASLLFTPCRSLRAFRRFIRKHKPQIKLILVSRYGECFDIEYKPKGLKQ